MKEPASEHLPKAQWSKFQREEITRRRCRGLSIMLLNPTQKNPNKYKKKHKPNKKPMAHEQDKESRMKLRVVKAGYYQGTTRTRHSQTLLSASWRLMGVCLKAL